MIGWSDQKEWARWKVANLGKVVCEENLLGKSITTKGLAETHCWLFRRIVQSWNIRGVRNRVTVAFEFKWLLKRCGYQPRIRTFELPSFRIKPKECEWHTGNLVTIVNESVQMPNRGDEWNPVSERTNSSLVETIWMLLTGEIQIVRLVHAWGADSRRLISNLTVVWAHNLSRHRLTENGRPRTSAKEQRCGSKQRRNARRTEAWWKCWCENYKEVYELPYLWSWLTFGRFPIGSVRNVNWGVKYV